MNARLHYVHDPMCSWCWAFRPVLDVLRESLPPAVPLVHVLGGLAPDTDEPMPPDLRAALEGTWRRIEAHVPGTRFDYRFWREATPRRATFRACRAVIAVRRQDPTLERAMIDAIQRAYYLEARNPSDRDVLIDLADGLGADAARVAEELDGEAVRAAPRGGAPARRGPRRAGLPEPRAGHGRGRATTRRDTRTPCRSTTPTPPRSSRASPR